MNDRRSRPLLLRRHAGAQIVGRAQSIAEERELKVALTLIRLSQRLQLSLIGIANAIET